MATLAATTAFAQSTATLYGVVDTGYRSVESGSNKFSGLANGSNLSNRLGFKGTEDMGGGMSAAFVMEGDLVPSDGTASGFKFLRQSTVGIMGGFGEVRLGRDYTPAFRVFGIVDPFGTVGVGSAGNILWSTVIAYPLTTTPGGAGDLTSQQVQDTTSTFTTSAKQSTTNSQPASQTSPRMTLSDPNVVRANNSFAYFSPDFSGFKASLMYSAGIQNTYALKNQGAMTGLSLNYANGPVVVAYANQITKGGFTQAGSGSTTTVGTDNLSFTTDFLAASYDLGVAKAGLGYRTEKMGDKISSLNTKAWIYSITAPLGAVTLKASYITKKAEVAVAPFTVSTDAGDQFAVGAVYDLSKRTALYVNYAQLSNKVGFANNVGSAAASAGGVKSSGFDVGVRHSF